MADVFNKTPAEFIDINTMFDVLNNRVGFEAEQLRAIVENTYWLYNYALEYHIPADSAMSDASTNSVQNKVIKAYVDNATSGLATNIESAAFTMQWQDFNTLQFKPLDGKKGASKTSADLNLIEVWFPDGVYTFTLNDTTARGRILALQQRLDQFDNWGYSFQEALSTLESRINTAELDIDNLQASSSNYATTENLNAVAGRVDTLESAIGDIGTLLDTINGEVI